MTKVYITGIAGFVGSNLASYLKHAGYDVYGCDNLSFGYEKNVPEEISWEIRSFTDLTENELCQYDVIVHAATVNLIYAQNNPIQTFTTNALHTIEFFNKIKTKIVYLSTASVYGNASVIPTPESGPYNMYNSYDTSKYISELFIQQKGNFTTLRLSNVYGPNQHSDHEYSGVIGKMIGAALKGKPIQVIGDGFQTRDFTFIDDVCDAIERAISIPAINLPLNIASGVETSILSLYNEVMFSTKSNSKIEFISPRQIDKISRRCLNIQMAKTYLGWSPSTSLANGINQTTEWMSESVR